MNHSSVHYRMAKIEDVEALVQLRILMQMEVNNYNEVQLTQTYKERVRQYFQRAILANCYFAALALDGKQIVANAGVCFYEKPPSISGGFGRQGYVTNVYTLKLYRGQGIATQLMKQLNELAIEKKADKLHLGATEDGIGIYQSVGYQPNKYPYLEINFADTKAL